VSEYVLDASALLVALFGEPGTERVEAILPQAVIGAVNLSEVIAKLQERGVPDEDISRDLKDLDLRVVSFDHEQADRAGRLRNSTKEIGLSLGDKCCLALAVQRDATAITADRGHFALERHLISRQIYKQRAQLHGTNGKSSWLEVCDSKANCAQRRWCGRRSPANQCTSVTVVEHHRRSTIHGGYYHCRNRSGEEHLSRPRH
jgi:PIN domain nuclease of toxin-antitoxin system